MPPLMNNHGNYIVSLGDVVRWLGEQAAELGVEIYPGFAAAEVLYDEDGAVAGVATGDMGVGRDGKPNDNFMRGMELHGKYTLLRRGRARLAVQAAASRASSSTRTASRRSTASGSRSCGRSRRRSTSPGLVQHTFGWPLDDRTGGGSFLYHYGDNLVAVGFVVHLNYENPYLSPYDEFQRFKTHPAIRATSSRAASASPMARARSPRAAGSRSRSSSFPGGALIGCAAGFMNVPRIKGSHNAMLSGIAGRRGRVRGDRRRPRPRRARRPTRRPCAPATSPATCSRVRNVKPLWSRFGT